MSSSGSERIDNDISAFWLMCLDGIKNVDTQNQLSPYYNSACWWTRSNFYRTGLWIIRIWSQGSSHPQADNSSHEVMDLIALFLLACFGLLSSPSWPLPQERDSLEPKPILFFSKMTQRWTPWDRDREVKGEMSTWLFSHRCLGFMFTTFVFNGCLGKLQKYQCPF